MGEIESLINLPLETLVILAAGYAGYKIAYTGKMKSHTSIDAILITLTFGLVAKLVMVVGESHITDLSALTIAAFLGAITVASCWRKWGEGILYECLRTSGVSVSDSTVTAWDTIQASTTNRPNRLVIRKKDGSQIASDNLWQFKKLPHGPCLYREDGSVSLYVTAYRKSAEDDWQDNNPLDDVYGATLTYVPASQTDEIEIRNQTNV